MTKDELSLMCRVGEFAAFLYADNTQAATDINELIRIAREQDEERVRLESAIRTHRDQRGDDRCWLDDHALYSVLDDAPEPSNHLALPPKCEFLKSCERYWEQRQTPDDKASGKNGPTIRQLEDENKELLSLIHRAYYSANRDGWQDGETTNEVTDAILATLCNAGIKPDADRPRGEDA
jgi:hypothetical protein